MKKYAFWGLKRESLNTGGLKDRFYSNILCMKNVNS